MTTPLTRAAATTAAPPGTRNQVISVVLIDDHDLVRQGIASLLSLDRSLHVVAQGASLAEGMVLARSIVADVAVIDVSLASSPFALLPSWWAGLRWPGPFAPPPPCSGEVVWESCLGWAFVPL